MKSQIYNLLFLVFLLLNGSLDYNGILKDTALNKKPSDFFKFNDQKIIFDGKKCSEFKAFGPCIG